MGRVTESAVFLTENFHRAPLMLIPCLWGRLDNAPVAAAAAQWGSLLPAVWSFMLAARERGLGSAWTTIHLMNDGEREAAEILGIPYDKFTQAGLFPIAYTLGTDFKPAKRMPLDTVLHWDTW
jgi:nitroreductase